MVRKKPNPLVSIIVLTFNSAEFVLETLESIKSQTYSNIELVISDDCSSDMTLPVCSKWLEKNNERFFRTTVVASIKNKGIAANCNQGLRVSTGEWIKFIAGDDVLEENIIEEYVNFIHENEEVKVVCSNIREYVDTFEAANARELVEASKFKFNNPCLSASEQFQILLRVNSVWAPTVMMQKKVVEEVGGFDERYPFFEDRPLWLALTKANHKLYYLDFVGVKYRIHKNSIQKQANNKTYFSRFEISRDDFIWENCISFYPPIERSLLFILLYRNLIIRKVLKNRRSWVVEVIAKLIGYFPNKYLYKYKLKYRF